MDRSPTPAFDPRRDPRSDGNLVRMLDATLADAANRGASDVHFEPQESAVRVRIRIDGCLREIQQFPAAAAPSLASRLKLLARMDIAERRLPQDGRMEIATANGERLEARVSALPTIHGEKLVLRLLPSKEVDLPIDALGLDDDQVGTLRNALGANSGMILVSGPTGSGKSTTLYAALNELNDGERNVVTAEDPVERRIAGVNQVQVNDEIGLTFANAQRAFLRQDPDVIMVGEIRDRDTAEIAVRAALTGHVVLSTLHATDAAASVTRLVDMGVAPFLVAASVRLVVAQRLLRVLCRACAGAGCAVCGDTGMRGRTGVFEVLPMSESLRSLVGRGASGDDIRSTAREEGMIGMSEQGQRKIGAGITTPKEVLRATQLW